MSLELAGRRAIVTGDSRGIGLAAARALVAECARVALVARGAGALEEAAHALSALATAANAGAAPSSAEREPRVIAVPRTRAPTTRWPRRWRASSTSRRRRHPRQCGRDAE
jgi:NAD(P)-dependent dehydrogenase (short-subunit alcohol dehydrogenase family)